MLIIGVVFCVLTLIAGLAFIVYSKISKRQAKVEKQRQAEEAKRQAEAEKQRQAEEAKRQAEAEKQRQAEEAKRQAEAEKQRQAEEAKRQAEAEKQRQAEEAKRQAEAEKQRQAEEAKRQTEAEKQRQAEEAKRQAEAEKQRQAEEAKLQAALMTLIGLCDPSVTLSSVINKEEGSLSAEEKRNLGIFFDNCYSKYIYHFSHIFNVAEMINSQRMLSRNKALSQGLLKADAAGSLVNRRHEAHKYVRFYFTTDTPTQFYNEGLGRQPSDHYYDRARVMGFPKCPVPVFLRFDLAEVLDKFPRKCYYSDGNLQQDRRSIFSVIEEPGRFNNKPYSWDEYREAVQQEFLVLGELDISALDSLEVFCYSESHRQLLENLCKDIPLRITVTKGNPFTGKNPMLELPFSGINRIRSGFGGEHLYKISGSCLDSLTLELPPEGTIVSQNSRQVMIRSQWFGWENFLGDIEISFIDERSEARSKEIVIWRKK